MGKKFRQKYFFTLFSESPHYFPLITGQNKYTKLAIGYILQNLIYVPNLMQSLAYFFFTEIRF